MQSANQPPEPHPSVQLNAADLHEAPEPLDANPDHSQDSDNALDPTEDQEALCANKIWDRPWINEPEETQKKQQKEGTCILCGEQRHFIGSWSKCQVMGHAIWTINGKDCNHIYRKQTSSLDLKDALNCRSDTDIFPTPAAFLCTMAFALDTLSAHLSSHSSHTLLLHTTLAFSANSIPTLVDSGTTDNFINESLAVLTPQNLWHLPYPPQAL
ncbi:hypothetical protein C0989_010810 [Termitomyces sp. Mn162]|nr:hypothetical protein C0989_010810 [Termitomyces sp. Mn162]